MALNGKWRQLPILAIHRQFYMQFRVYPRPRVWPWAPINLKQWQSGGTEVNGKFRMCQPQLAAFGRSIMYVINGLYCCGKCGRRSL